MRGVLLFKLGSERNAHVRKQLQKLFKGLIGRENVDKIIRRIELFRSIHDVRKHTLARGIDILACNFRARCTAHFFKNFLNEKPVPCKKGDHFVSAFRRDVQDPFCDPEQIRPQRKIAHDPRIAVKARLRLKGNKGIVKQLVRDGGIHGSDAQLPCKGARIEFVRQVFIEKRGAIPVENIVYVSRKHIHGLWQKSGVHPQTARNDDVVLPRIPDVEDFLRRDAEFTEDDAEQISRIFEFTVFAGNKQRIVPCDAAFLQHFLHALRG